MKKEIKIAGAGPAGLSAAINLAKAGYKVTVYERNSDVGFKSNGDFQGLENWTKDEDVIKALKRMNIKPTFKYTPMKKVEFYDHKSKQYLLKSKKPMAYLVCRGNAKGCLDYALKKQALKAGVKILFNKKVSETQVDIVATGPKKYVGLAEGITFDTDLPNTVLAILDDSIAPNAYAYMTVIDKKACIVTCTTEKFGKLNTMLNKTIKRIQKLKKFKIKNKKTFACGGNFFISDSAIKNKRLYTGEAAGFQDYFYGFGMRYAITSGYLAAQSKIHKKNYDELWKHDFGAIHKQGISSRLTYEWAGKEKYASILKSAAKEDGLNFFMKVYRPSILKLILYPFAKMLYKDRKVFK